MSYGPRPFDEDRRKQILLSGKTRIIMWLTYTLITWTTCLFHPSVSNVEPTTALYDLLNVAIENEEIGNNLSMSEIGDAFRRQISQIIISVDAQDSTVEMNASVSTSNVSLEDYQDGNGTYQNLYQMRDSRKKQRIQAIKDSILLLTGRGGLLNASFLHNERSFGMQNGVLQNVSALVDSGITQNTSESRAARRRSVDSNNAEAFSKMYVETDTPRQKIPVKFTNLGMQNLIVIPEGFNWVLCSHYSSANFEIFDRLTSASYPVPIRRQAASVIEVLVEVEFSMDTNCIPTGWRDMSIIYINENSQPRYALLEKFLPTNCACRRDS